MYACCLLGPKESPEADTRGFLQVYFRTLATVAVSCCLVHKVVMLS